MSSVMARTPTVTRHKDFMAAPENGRPTPPLPAPSSGRAQGAGSGRAPPAGPGGAAPQSRLSAAAEGAPVGPGTGHGPAREGLGPGAQRTTLGAVPCLPGKRKTPENHVWF